MTRDEAIEKLRTDCPHLNCDFRLGLVQALQALGLLKLDEPKSLETIIFDEFNSSLGTMHYHRMKETLERLGLKIVEK